MESKAARALYPSKHNLNNFLHCSKGRTQLGLAPSLKQSKAFFDLKQHHHLKLQLSDILILAHVTRITRQGSVSPMLWSKYLQT